MKKKILSLLMAVVLVCLSIGMSALAADLPDTDTAEPYATSGERTITATRSMSLPLDPGKSGWSSVTEITFTLPKNAIVDTVKIVPGTATVNGGNTHMLGVVKPTSLKITSPTGQTKELAWNKTMTTTSFWGQNGSGTWRLSFYGTNLTMPQGDQYDLLRVGGMSYKPKVTITYTVE